MEKYIKYFRFFIIPQSIPHTNVSGRRRYIQLGKRAQNEPAISIIRALLHTVSDAGFLCVRGELCFVLSLSMLIEWHQTEVTLNGASKWRFAVELASCTPRRYSNRHWKATFNEYILPCFISSRAPVGKSKTLETQEKISHKIHFCSISCSIYFVNCIIFRFVRQTPTCCYSSNLSLPEIVSQYYHKKLSVPRETTGN